MRKRDGSFVTNFFKVGLRLIYYAASCSNWHISKNESQRLEFCYMPLKHNIIKEPLLCLSIC